MKRGIVTGASIIMWKRLVIVFPWSLHWVILASYNPDRATPVATNVNSNPAPTVVGFSLELCARKVHSIETAGRPSSTKPEKIV